jgi:hypothetical protein
VLLLPSDQSVYKARVLLAVWGESFIKNFLEFSLPSLLAPGNLPALAGEYPLTFVFLTRPSDVSILDSSPVIRHLKQYCKVEYESIKDLIVLRNSSITLTYAYDRAIRHTGEEMLSTYFIFLTSDYIMADGSLQGLMRYLKKGYSGICAGNFQVIKEEMDSFLRSRMNEHGILQISPRELMKYSLTSLHPVTRASICNQSYFHNYCANRFFVEDGKNNLAGRFYLLHMLCIKPETMDYQLGAFCDYAFIPEMCASGNIAIINDSDDYLVVEAQPKSHELNYVNWGPYEKSRLVRALCEWATDQHRSNARETIYYHVDDLTASDKDLLNQQLEQFVGELNDRLLQSPAQPFRGHPYWLGVTRPFTKSKNSTQSDGVIDDEYVNYIGLQGYSRARGLYFALFGAPPYVRPWHYRWLEYQTVMRNISEYLKESPHQKVLVLYDSYLQDFLQYRNWLEQRFECHDHYYLPDWQKTLVDDSRIKYDSCLIMVTVGGLDKLTGTLEKVRLLIGQKSKVLVLVVNEKRHLSNFAYHFLGEFTARLGRIANANFMIERVLPVRSNASLFGAMTLNYILLKYADSKKARFLIYLLLALPAIFITMVTNWWGKISNRGHCANILVTLTPEQGCHSNEI